MKTSSAFAVLPVLALAACGSPSDPPKSDTGANLASCPSYKTQLAKCTDKGDKPVVEIDTDKMTFKPEFVCSKKDRTITFILDPPPDDKDGTAAIFPKDFEDTWLVGTNTPAKDKIRIKVPKWVDAKTYSYNFIKNDKNCVDPRIEVTH